MPGRQADDTATAFHLITDPRVHHVLAAVGRPARNPGVRQGRVPRGSRPCCARPRCGGRWVRR
ncbi:hypothetical protein [Streptomyces sp. yr375]|uniref:hypothetical protein n=1 Tax=Streptomyces sp. yr375 TaxID=1761906 RepID=UPI001160B3BB|nr:hypothetical protein [Streptomyces sp. yr375]